MRDVILVVEGGGNRDLDQSLRAAIDEFVDDLKNRVRQARRHWRTVPGGGRNDAYNLFLDQAEKHPAHLVLLLVDSEESPAVSEWKASRWARRAEKDRRIFFMVRCMETWIVSDPEWLEENHRGLKVKSLPKGSPEEHAPEVLRKMLEVASQDCGWGPYEKRHGPMLLASVRPEVVAGRCDSARAFLDGLDALIR